MATKVNKELFLRRLKEKHGDKVELLSEYYGKEKQVEIVYHCEQHGDTIARLNAKNIFGHNFNPCKECVRHKHSEKRHNSNDKEYFYEKLKNCCSMHNGSVIETEWTKAKDTYHFKCENPNHPVFTNTADGIMNKHQWCPYCSGRKGSFEQEISEIIHKQNGELLSSYKNSYTHITVKCLEHDYEWNIMPLNLIKGRWCPICHMPTNEKPVWNWLKSHNFNVVAQYKFSDLIGEDGNPYRFDFGIVDDNKNLLFLLEIDDETHRGVSEQYLKQQRRDKIKNEYCNKHKIPLYRMPIDRWKIHNKGVEWYYDYMNNELGFLIEKYSKTKCEKQNSDYIKNKECV